MTADNVGGPVARLRIRGRGVKPCWARHLQSPWPSRLGQIDDLSARRQAPRSYAKPHIGELATVRSSRALTSLNLFGAVAPLTTRGRPLIRARRRVQRRADH